MLQRMWNVSCCYITVLNIKYYLKCIHFRGLQTPTVLTSSLFDSSIEAQGKDSFNNRHILQTTLTKIRHYLYTQLSTTEKNKQPYANTICNAVAPHGIIYLH